MRRMAGYVVGLALAVGVGTAGAHEGEEHGAGTAPQQAPGEAAVQEQTLTGEVVDVFCYLSHGEEGLGAKHAGCAKKCIKGGLPVAIKVGDRLYLASMADHTAANERLRDLAAQQVTVRGQVMERDGQHLVAISSIEPTE